MNFIKQKIKRPRKVLRSWIISYMTVLLIVILLVFATNRIYTGFIIDDIVNLKQAELTMLQKNMDEIAENLKKSALELYGNRRLSEIYDRDYPIESNWLIVKEIMKSLKNQLTSIDDFYIFLKDRNIVINSIGYIENPQNFYKSYYRNSDINYSEWVNSVINCKQAGYHVIKENKQEGYGLDKSEFCYMLPLKPLKGIDATVIAVADSSRYEKSLEGYLKDNDEATVLVYDEGGTEYFSSGKYIPSEEQLKQSELHNDFYESEILKNRVVIRNIKSGVSGWHYAIIVPYAVFWQRLTLINYVSVVIFVLLILLGVLCVYIASRHNYKSLSNIVMKIEKKFSGEKFNNCNEYEIINNLVDMTERLGRDVQMQEKDICAGKVFNLLRGVGSDDFGTDLYSEYDNMFRSDYFVVLVFDTHSYLNLFENEKMSDEERLDVTKLIIQNVMTELLEKHGSVNTVTNNSVIFLFSPNEKLVDKAQSLAIKDAKKALEFVREHFMIELECGISCVKHGTSDICVAYSEACDAVKMQIPSDDRGIYVAKDVFSSNIRFYYSPEQERYFVDMLVHGYAEEAVRYFKRIIMFNKDKNDSEPLVRALLLDLAGSIAKAAASRACPFSGEGLMRFALRGNLSQTNEIFETSIRDVCKSVDKQKKSSDDILCEKIDAVISEKYTDPALSLTMIAQILNMNSNYLSGAYKKKTQINIVDRIQHQRLEAAITLMKNGEETLEHIADETGFGSISTFNRVFKKFTGMSAGKYRETKL